ncbi:MAG: hypothetical protein CMP20_04015 [Rickettsiales bacterium]|nr:hypothetical protein [Rickettsiales bacterium]
MSEKEKPETNPKVEGLKVKKKPGRPRKLVEKSKVTKVDLNNNQEPKTEENAVQERETKEVLMGESSADSKKVDEQVRVESNKDDTKQEEEKVESPLSQVDNEKEEPKVEKTTPVVETPKLPENVEKLVSFMEETGGNLEDYVRLNRDYSNINDDVLLVEYYKNTKPHLEVDEINFLLEDQFYFDDEVEDEKAIKKKQLARKEEIAKAKNFLEETKSKYYDEIKLRPGITQDQQKAMDFFNRYNTEQEKAKQKSDAFQEKTRNYFKKDEFKGFQFDLGDKKFRYGIKDTEKTSTEQSSIQNFLGKFLQEDGTIGNMEDYHKALYMANNPDTVAKHFYDQGVADATKNIVAQSKNISSEPRSSDPGDVFVNGFKVRAITGADSSKLKIQRKLKNT